jgi:aldehyde dehydrogenase (NAD+)
MGILFNQGQVCCAGSRVFVQEGIYDKFVEEAVKRFKMVKVGMPLKEDTQMGSQINKTQLEKIEKYVKIGQEEGAKLLVGGHKITTKALEKGCFFEPTLLGDVTNDMRVAQEEIFGPVAVIIKFKDEAEVVKMANDSVYGLGGAVWTTNLNRALRVSRAVETGRMWVNTYNAIPEGAPFGGYKQSGVGRETHKVILEHYTQMKNIMINMSEVPSGFYPVK